ncbi:MAG: HAMP domain-containing sensor histidine kinase [Deinococcales bacterium]
MMPQKFKGSLKPNFIASLKLRQRLAFRLALAMIGSMLIGVVIIATSQYLGQRFYFQSLAPEVQARITLLRSRSTGEENFHSFVSMMKRSTLRGITITSLLVLFIAIYFAKKLAEPIERVTKASLKVAQGDLATRIKPVQGASLEVLSLTENFNKMADALERYEAERKDMIASIAHDLRTPLTAIQIRLEALKEELIPFNQSEVDILLAQSQLLGRLVNDLRTLSLADAGKLSLNLQKLNFAELLDEVLKNYQLKAEHQGVHIKRNMPDKTLFIKADAQRMAQVLGNLLNNAFEAMPQGGELKIAVQQIDRELELSIADSGAGIEVDLLPQMFQRFIRGKDKGGSSGLGLAIVKTLIDLHHGSVKASNGPQGAVFSFKLPLFGELHS